MWKYYGDLFPEQGFEAYFKNVSFCVESDIPRDNSDKANRKAESLGKLKIGAYIYQVSSDEERWATFNALLQQLVEHRCQKEGFDPLMSPIIYF